MDTCLGVRIALHANGLPRTFPRAGVRGCSLAPNRKSPQMADAPVALDALKPLQIQPQLPAQVTLGDILAVLDRMHDLGQLLLIQRLRPQRRIDLGSDQDLAGVHGPDTVNVPESDVDSLLRWYVDSKNTWHKLKSSLTLLVTSIAADHSDHTLASHHFAVLAQLFD